MLLGEAGGQDETAPFFVSFDSQKKALGSFVWWFESKYRKYRLFYI